MLGAVLLASCGSDQSTRSTTTTAARGAVLGNLRLAIFDRLPSAYIEDPAGSESDGHLDLPQTAQAVDDQETAQQETILQNYGFRSAYQRTWVIKGTSEILIIRVQVMGSSTEAIGYFNLLTVADRVSLQVKSFSTPQLIDASGFTRSFSESTGNQVALDINMARGRLFYHLILTGPRGSISPNTILRIASSQSAEAESLGYTSAVGT